MCVDGSYILTNALVCVLVCCRADSNMPDPQNCLQVQEMGTDDMCLQDLVHSRTQRIKTSLKLL